MPPRVTKGEYIKRRRAMNGDGLSGLFHKKPPPRLYHYTSQQGLIGIVESKSFLSTEVRYLNDAEEFTYALARAKDAIRKQTANSLTPGIKEFGQSVVAELEHTNRQFFVFSLTEESDSLNQWRSYTSRGPGYALGFASDRITNLCVFHGFRFGKCIYSKNDAEDLISQIAMAYVKDFAQHFPYFGKGEINEGLISSRSQKFVEFFLEFAALIKNPAFKDELEWRIIAPREKFEAGALGFRGGPHSIVPFAKIDFGSINFLTALKEVVIKPSPHMEMASNSLLEFIRSQHQRAELPIYEITDFEITKSKVPFREGI